MARKHENFAYNHGWRTAPEQYNFFLNRKLIHLDSDTRNSLACLVIYGNKKEAEDKLKRMLRAEEKKINNFVTIGFFYKGEDKRYVYTKDLIARRTDQQDMLRIYKAFKTYCEKLNCEVSTHTVTSGFVTPYGMEKVETHETKELVDTSKPCLIKIKFSNNQMFN